MKILLLALFTPLLSIQIFCMAFLGVLFTQSGLDKLFNYKDNLKWLSGHFSKSPLKNMVGLMMPAIMILEIAAGLLSLAGIVILLLSGSVQLGLIGAQLSALSILALFFGQRMAQEYEGAASLVGYFLVSIASIYVLGMT